MSFAFKWPRFSEEFHRDARALLETALNKGNKPPIIADKIEVIELEMGTEPPELQIREIGDLTLDQFRGIFRLSYSGDAHIVLRTKVQANPLTNKRPDIHRLGGSRGMLAAHQPLVVPMLLRLSHFVLNGYVVLVVSKQKGITLVFKTDPLQNVDVNSTFDSIAVIQKYIQGEIEGQLREMFREDLPGIIHRLSQRWVAGKTRVEAPYLSRQTPRTRAMSDIQEYMVPQQNRTLPTYASSLPGNHSPLRRPLSRITSISSMHRDHNQLAPHSAPAPSTAAGIPPVTPLTSIPDPSSESSFPDIENYDPTYGLRPDDLPTKSGYSGFGRLFGSPRGLADLTEHPTDDDVDWNGSDSYDLVEWEDTVSLGPPPSVASEDSPEYETIPAVGGGTITRPRIYHSQSSIRSPLNSSDAYEQQDSRSTSPNGLYGVLSGQSTPLPTQEIGFAPPFSLRQNQSVSTSRQAVTASSLMSGPPTGTGTSVTEWQRRESSIEGSSANKIPSNERDGLFPQETSSPDRFTERHLRQRSLSTSTYRSLDGTSPGSHFVDSEGHIVLRPGLSNTISQLSTLSHSYHTLSPYARSLEHFTVRSVPHRIPPSNPLYGQPRKARRKRIYHLNKKTLDSTIQAVESDRSSSSSPAPPSEFEASEVEHYFRAPASTLRHRISFQTS